MGGKLRGREEPLPRLNLGVPGGFANAALHRFSLDSTVSCADLPGDMQQACQRDWIFYREWPAVGNSWQDRFLRFDGAAIFFFINA